MAKSSKKRGKKKRPNRLKAVKKLVQDKETRALIFEIIRAIIAGLKR